MSSYRNIYGNLGAQALIERLNDDEKEEAADLLDYLSEKASKGNSGIMAEGSIASLLNKASPKVREAFGTLSEMLETPRIAPFSPKMSERDHADALDLDPDQTELVKGVIDGQYVASSLLDRMGSDKDLPDEPPSTRDIIGAAYDAHTENEGADHD